MKCDHQKYWEQFEEIGIILTMHDKKGSPKKIPKLFQQRTYENFLTWMSLGRPVLAKRLKVKQL